MFKGKIKGLHPHLYCLLSEMKQRPSSQGGEKYVLKSKRSIKHNLPIRYFKQEKQIQNH